MTVHSKSFEDESLGPDTKIIEQREISFTSLPIYSSAGLGRVLMRAAVFFKPLMCKLKHVALTTALGRVTQKFSFRIINLYTVCH